LTSAGSAFRIDFARKVPYSGVPEAKSGRGGVEKYANLKAGASL
jgi:hypothetical protein